MPSYNGEGPTLVEVWRIVDSLPIEPHEAKGDLREKILARIAERIEEKDRWWTLHAGESSYVYAVIGALNLFAFDASAHQAEHDRLLAFGKSLIAFSPGAMDEVPGYKSRNGEV